MKVRSKKGVTLVELCIVMGLLSIVVSLVLSYCILIDNYTTAIASDEAVMSDFDSIDNVLDNWISFFDSSEYEINVGEGNSSLHVQNKKSKKHFDLAYFEDTSMLIGSYYIFGSPRNGVFYSELENVDNLYFTISSHSSNDYLLINCKITYKNLNLYGTSESQFKSNILRTTKAMSLNRGE